MVKCGVMFQINNSIWYKGGKIHFQPENLVLTFFGKIIDEINYSDIIEIKKDFYLYHKIITITARNKKIHLIPGFFNKRLYQEFSRRNFIIN
jgi:hypothetical protein